ncbi:MAG TPA: hypothetical protein VKV26_11160 [Dehalococcoidia bacterium]|nr:hypothetical protein [Dehalococcoidia bacterium]
MNGTGFARGSWSGPAMPANIVRFPASSSAPSASGTGPAAVWLVSGVVLLGVLAVGVAIDIALRLTQRAPANDADHDSLANVPVDDEAETPEEATAAAEGYAALARGEVVPWEEARQSLAGTNGAAQPAHPA